MNLFVVEGQCYTFGTNQFGQLGNQTNNSRQPQEVKIAQTQKVAMVACGDTFTVIVADGNNWFKNIFIYRLLKTIFFYNYSLFIASVLMTVRIFSSTFSEGEVYSFGNQSRGRLGRPEEDPTEPGKVPFMGEDPFVVVSLSCSHGNTLLATRRMKLLTPVII